MAIWQYNISIIPKESVLQKHGEVPNKLIINHEAWEKYWDNYTEGKEPNFEDAKTINWWKKTNISVTELSKDIDTIIPRANWGSKSSINWKGNTENNEDNDASLIFNSVTNEIEEMTIRIDLRDPDKFPQFLESLCSILKKRNLLLMDLKGNLMEPSVFKISKHLLDSNAIKFLIDPEDFLNSLQK